MPYTYHPQDGTSVCSSVDDDFDVDFVPDNTDNCPQVANKDQADLNRDGWGDVCDDIDGDQEPDQQDEWDKDGDGVPDHLDKCPGTPAGVPVAIRSPGSSRIKVDK